MTTYSLRDLGISAGRAKRDELFVELPPYVQAGLDYTPARGGADAVLEVSAMVEGTAFHLRFDADYQGPCSRCLEDATFAASIDAYQVHDPRVVADPEAEDGEELRSEHVDDEAQELDLTGWAREEVGLVFPSKVLCRPDCPGLGSSWSDPPSEDEVDAHGNAIDPRWAALKSLQGDGDASV